MKTAFLYSVLFLMFACQQPYKGAMVSNSKAKTYSYIKNKPKKISRKEQRKKLTVRMDRGFHIFDLFRNEQKRRELKCPHEGKKKKREMVEIPEEELVELKDEGTTNLASIRIYEHDISFDVLHVEEKSLDIPVFKQFKNNMTDFTANGEEEFKHIIELIQEYAGDNTHQQEVTLYIEGGASQIPTSFDPEKPNNGIYKDGTSIKGQTSVENNIKLAHARAVALKDKIHDFFPEINIVVTDVIVGKTEWTAEVQRALDEAYLSGNQVAMDKVFKPFQKDQFVKVYSEDMFIKTVEPNNIKMYKILTRPYLKTEDEQETRGHIIISAKAYEQIGKNRYFETVEERDEYLTSLGLRLKKSKAYDNHYLISDSKAEKTLDHDKEYERIYQLYINGIVNEADKQILEDIIVDQHLGQSKYKYVLKK